MYNRSILLVDDEQIILDSLSRELRSTSDRFEVAVASSGEEALEQLGGRPWDLVITDLLMPHINGFQVLKAAKQHNRQTMVMILTGYADMEAAIKALRLGADDFLQKPCDTDELLYRMSNCFVKQDLLKKVDLYENILPVCCYCKRIRDDLPTGHGKGQWYTLEEYYHKVQGVNVSHGCCPECFSQYANSVFRS